MIEQAKNGVSYAVEVKREGDPRDEWTTRYGWFPETPGEDHPGEEPGLERAERNLAHALESGEYTDARIVRRLTEVEAVETGSGGRRVVDVRFTFRAAEPEPDGYVDLELIGIERTRCDLTDEQASGVGEDWAQSDRYSIGYSMDLIGVVSDNERADYSKRGPRLW